MQVLSSGQSFSPVQIFPNPWTAACHASLSITNSWSLFRLIQPSHPLSSPSPPAFNLSHIWVFSKESVLHIRWPKYWSFSFSPFNEYSGLISFRNDWFDLLAVQETLKSLLQHHSFKASTSALSLLCSPTLTSVHDYYKNHSFDDTKFCQQSDVSAF